MVPGDVFDFVDNNDKLPLVLLSLPSFLSSPSRPRSLLLASNDVVDSCDSCGETCADSRDFFS